MASKQPPPETFDLIRGQTYSTPQICPFHLYVPKLCSLESRPSEASVSEIYTGQVSFAQVGVAEVHFTQDSWFETRASHKCILKVRSREVGVCEICAIKAGAP